MSAGFRRLHGPIDADPEIHGVQFFPSTGFQIQEELHAVGGIVAEHEVEDQEGTAILVPEHFDFFAEPRIGTGFEKLCVESGEAPDRGLSLM